MLTFIKLIDENAAEIYAKKVINLKDNFNTYSNNKYSVLGAASYANDLNSYLRIKNKTNPIIENYFNDLLFIVKNFIEKTLNTPCIFDENLSLPGFHIFYPNHIDACSPLTSLHIDLPYELHKEYFKNKYSSIDFDFPLTFTLSLKLPKSGGFLWYWDEKGWENKTEDDCYELYDNIDNKYKIIFADGEKVPTLKEYEEFLMPKRLTYKIGYMVLFRGNLLHQIGPFEEPLDEQDLRITLQGHGLLCDNKWILYF